MEKPIHNYTLLFNDVILLRNVYDVTETFGISKKYIEKTQFYFLFKFSFEIQCEKSSMKILRNFSPPKYWLYNNIIFEYKISIKGLHASQHDWFNYYYILQFGERERERVSDIKQKRERARVYIFDLMTEPG